MKQRIIKSICALALLGIGGCNMLFFAGCRTVSIEKNCEGWEVTVRSNMMKSEVDGMEAEISPDGTVKWKMGGLTSSPSEEFTKSLMTLTYIARLAAAMYSPGAATVPLSEEAADPQAVATAVKAQAEAKAAIIKAKADAAATKAQAKQTTSATSTCTGDSCAPSVK